MSAQQQFVRKRVKSLTLGEKLQQLREDRHLRVIDLSRKINIKSAYIIALEKGVYDDLPTKVYAKGFVRSYARFFGVPEHVLLDLFEKEYSIYRNITNKDEEETVSRLPKVPRFVFTPRVIFILFGFIILLGIGVYLYFGVDNFVSSPWLVVDEPLNNSVVNTDTVVVRGTTRSNSRVLINGQQIFVDLDGRFSDEVGLSPGVNTINVTSVNKFDRESQQRIVVDAQYEIEQEQPQEDDQNVVMYITAQDKPVWIKVSADGVDVYNDTIQLEEIKEFRAAERITVTTSSGKNTLVSFDEKEYESIGEEDGVVEDWVYDGDELEEEERDEEVVN
jgi:transcriptional regulator with XRE-family HTH domain